MTLQWLLSWWNLIFVLPFGLALLYLGLYTVSGNMNANKDQRLGPAYQLPIAVILNDRGGSAPEVLAAGLKENKRATIVGGKSAGCLGSTSNSPLGSDGSQLYVVQQEFVGAVTGTKYNIGIQPDVPADDASAIAAASKVLLDKIAGK